MAFGFSSCNETWDDNPVIKTHEGTLQADFLNTPTMQDQSLMITNDNKTGTLHLTCSQPDYGYAAIATYKVQCSLKEDFADFLEIDQAFTNCAQINPVNNDVAQALEKLSGVKTEADLPLPYQKLYIRLRAYVEQDPEHTEYISNVVSFNSISADYLAIWVADVPVNIYIRGGVNGWGSDPSWQFMTGNEENTWVLNNVIIPANDSFKIADSSWGLNLGGNAGENENAQMIDPEGTVELTSGDNPGHLRFKSEFKGNLTLRLEKGTYSLTIDPTK